MNSTIDTHVEADNIKCWFCRNSTSPLVFENEFDTYVHIDCIREELSQQPMNIEALVMRYLLPEYKNEDTQGEDSDGIQIPF